MRNQDGTNVSIVKPAVVSFTSGLLGLLSFFLMFNWTYGEYLIAPTLLLAFVSLDRGSCFCPKDETFKREIIRENDTLYSRIRDPRRGLPPPVVPPGSIYTLLKRAGGFV